MNVMMSIKPEWCKRIINGEKTIEVRKTKPEQIETPFTVYVYATFGGENWFSFGKQKSGHVIGKVTCDKVVRYDIPYSVYWEETSSELLEKSCIPYMQLQRYAREQNYVYGWHIRDFENWDIPLSVREFINSKGNVFKKPPQSWAYSYLLKDSSEIIKVRPLKAGGPVFADKLEVDAAGRT